MKRPAASIDPPCVERGRADRSFPISHSEEVVAAIVKEQIERVLAGHANWYLARRIAAAANRLRKA